ncbi:MAG: SpoIVB peptidase S55 domain-containing protein, partial [Pseudomonadota bacterium]
MRPATNVIAAATTLCALSAIARAVIAAAVVAAPVSPAVQTKPAAGAARETPVRAIIPAGPPPRILPLSQVKAGMVGQALTVFQGTKPEPFKVRVVSIMRQFLPKQDVILIRAEDPRVAFSGIVAGMSGSPVYVDGKLMGAIAYGWSFSKEPLGGVTPIESMLAERERPRRDKKELATETDSGGIRFLTAAEGGPTRDGNGAPAFLTRAAVSSPAVPLSGGADLGRLVPVAVPLSVSGFDPRALVGLTDELRSVGLVPVQAGGGRKVQMGT